MTADPVAALGADYAQYLTDLLFSLLLENLSSGAL